MKNIVGGILLFISSLTATTNTANTEYKSSVTLPDLFFRTIRDSFISEELKILRRIYPKIFDSNNFSELSSSTFFNSLVNPSEASNQNSFIIKELDLSGLNIERIPLRLAETLREAKVLNLSNNPLIELDEKWIVCFYENLKELNLNDCYLDDNVFRILKNFKKLKKLSISGTKNINTNSKSFLSVLKKLKHLDVSQCRLDTSDFLNIIKNGMKLKSLNFSHNDLLNINDVELKNEILYFYVNNPDPKELTNFDALVYAFSSYQNRKYSEISFDARLWIQRMKYLNLRNCSLVCKDFVKLLFNFPNLETLILSDNAINFDYTAFSAKNNLKRLELENCYLKRIENLFEFTNFEKLEILNISNNNFADMSIGFEMGCSKNSLVELNISKCNIREKTLAEFTKCTKLKLLNASKNNFASIAEDFNFSNLYGTLVDLNMHSSSLQNESLKAFIKFSNLQKLNISSNSFDELQDDFDLGDLKASLINLDISDCNLNKKIISLFTNLPNLQILNASGNYFNFFVAESELQFGCSKNSLINLNLKSCMLDKNDLESIKSCTRIQELDIHCNDLHLLPQDFDWDNLKSTLISLNVSSCCLNMDHLKTLTKFSKLQKLNALDNLFRFSDNFGFGNLEKTLRELALDIASYAFEGLKAINNCLILQKLDLSGSTLGNVPEDLDMSNLYDSLVELILRDTRLEGSSLKVINYFSKLEKLDLSKNNIKVGFHNFGFGKIKDTLLYLNLSNCNLNFEQFNKITHFSKLRNLDFSLNYMCSIPIDFDLGNFKHTLVELYLKNTRINSELNIVTIIEKLKKLQILDLRSTYLNPNIIREMALKYRQISPLIWFEE